MADAGLVLGSGDTRSCTVLRRQLCPAQLRKALMSAFGAPPVPKRTRMPCLPSLACLRSPEGRCAIPAQAVKQRPPCSEVPWCTCVDGGHGDRSAAGAREAAGLRVLAALQQQVLAHRALGHSPHHRFLAGLQGASHHAITCHEQHSCRAEAVCLPAVWAARPPSMNPLRSLPYRPRTYQHLSACLCTFCTVIRTASCDSRPSLSRSVPTEAACACPLQLHFCDSMN